MPVDPLGLKITIQVNDLAAKAVGQIGDKLQTITSGASSFNKSMIEATRHITRLSSIDFMSASAKSMEGFAESILSVQENIMKAVKEGGDDTFLSEDTVKALEKTYIGISDHIKATVDHLKNVEDSFNKIVASGGDLTQIDRKQLDHLKMSVKAITKVAALRDAILASGVDQEVKDEALKRIGFERVGDLLKHKELSDKILQSAQKMVPIFAEGEKQLRKAANQKESLKKWVETTGAPSGLVDLIAAATAVAAVLVIMKAAFAEVIKTTEAYRFSTMRVSGSISDMTKMTGLLARELGVSNEYVRESVTALAKVGARKEEVEGLAKSVTVLTVATGASADEAALLAKRVVGLTGSMEAANNIIYMLTAASAKMGLTTDDVNAVMSEFNSSIYDMTAILKLDKEGTERYAKSLMVMASAARKAGVDVRKTMSAMTDIMQNPLDNIALMSMRWGEFSKAMASGKELDMFSAIGGAAKDWLTQMEGVDPIIKSMISKRVFGRSLGDLEAMAKTEEEIANQAKEMAKIEALGPSKEAMKDFKESLSTVTQGFKALWGVIQSIGTSLAPLLQVVGKVVGFIAEIVGKVINWIPESWGLVKSLWALVVVITTLVGAKAFVKGAFWLAKHIKLFSGLTNVIKSGVGWIWKYIFGEKAKTAVQAISTKVLKLNTMAQKESEIATQGSAKSARLLGPAAVNMLAFGAALLMVGAAAWLFAEAAKTLDGHIGALFALGGVLVVLGAGMAFVSAIGVVAAPVMLALGAALLLMGVGVLAASYGLSLLVDSMSKLDPVSIKDIAISMMLVSGAIISLSTAAVFGLPGIVALSASIGILGAILWFWQKEFMIFAVSIAMIGDAMSKIDTSPLKNLMDFEFRKLKEASEYVYELSSAMRSLAVTSALAGFGLSLFGRSMPIATVKPTGVMAVRERDRENREKLQLNAIKEIKDKIPSGGDIYDMLAQIRDILNAQPRKLQESQVEGIDMTLGIGSVMSMKKA